MAGKKFVFVVLCEHYHFPPNDSDMAGCSVLGYFAASQKGWDAALEYAKNRVMKQVNPLGRPLQKYQNGERESRFWLECPPEDTITDRLVYVVRKALLNPA